MGLLLMLRGPDSVSFFGTFVHHDFGSWSLIRLAGVGFFLVGVLLLAVREIVDPGIQRRVSCAMMAAHVLGALMVWAQQIAIWGSPAGAILAGWLTLIPATFGLLLMRQRHPVSAGA